VAQEYEAPAEAGNGCKERYDPTFPGCPRFRFLRAIQDLIHFYSPDVFSSFLVRLVARWWHWLLRSSDPILPRQQEGLGEAAGAGGSCWCYTGKIGESASERAQSSLRVRKLK